MADSTEGPSSEAQDRGLSPLTNEVSDLDIIAGDMRRAGGLGFAMHLSTEEAVKAMREPATGLTILRNCDPGDEDDARK